MNEPSTIRSEQWRQRLQRVQHAGARARLRLQTAAPFALGVVAALTALLLYNLLFPGPAPLTASQVSDTVAMAMASATPPPAFSAQVYQAIQPSLVLIQTESREGEDETGSGLGTGVVVSERGDILTSLHVVAGADSIELIFADGSKSGAVVTAEMPEKDIAVLGPTEPPAQLIPAVLGNPYAMRVGDEAFAVGNPFGLYASMSAGVISGFGRSFHPPGGEQKLEDLIQIDAAVNPGNSGGPLLNRYGQVVGIVVGIVNPTEQEVFIGIGFAVPIDVAGGAAGLPPY
jgi:S1-C subfamily serine protease